MPFFRPRTQPSRYVLIGLLAALMSLLAFAVDSMLPALPAIADEFTPEAPSRAQLVVGSYVFGSGIGMLLFGPLADSYGRRVSAAAGIGLYMVAALAAGYAKSAEALFFFRMLQGFGGSAARNVAQAVTRDLFSGAEQARVSSITFMFFVVIPALAPFLGQQVIAAWSWQALFLIYVVFAGVVLTAFLAFIPETLAPERRRPFRPGAIWAAAVEVIRTPVALRYLAVMTLVFGQLVGYISQSQPIFDQSFGAADRFPLYFAIISLVSAASGLLNAALVTRVGMRRLVAWAFGGQAVAATLYVIAQQSGALNGLSAETQLWVFVGWSGTLFFMNGITFGNTAALSMEPLGHIAGTAAAVLGALSGAVGSLIAIAIGQSFDGTARPLVAAVAVTSTLGAILVINDVRQRDRRL